MTRTLWKTLLCHHCIPAHGRKPVSSVVKGSGRSTMRWHRKPVIQACLIRFPARMWSLKSVCIGLRQPRGESNNTRQKPTCRGRQKKQRMRFPLCCDVVGSLPRLSSHFGCIGPELCSPLEGTAFKVFSWPQRPDPHHTVNTLSL